MSLQSFGFFGFLLVVAAVYLHLPQRWQSAFLLAASWVFYALAMPSMLPVTIAIAVFTYLCGRGMTAREGARKAVFLRIGVVGLLAILAFFKYNGAFASDGGWQAVAMPLGISFYSFAAISYLIDAARGDCEVEKNFIDCALFLNFFATVTQGPICRAGALLPQFKKEHRFDAARTVRALRLMALGLFKLVAVSDVLGLLVDEVFPNYRSYGGPMLVLAAVFYTFQLYFNFSGYSEVAREKGLRKLHGAERNAAVRHADGNTDSAVCAGGTGSTGKEHCTRSYAEDVGNGVHEAAVQELAAGKANRGRGEDDFWEVTSRWMMRGSKRRRMRRAGPA